MYQSRSLAIWGLSDLDAKGFKSEFCIEQEARRVLIEARNLNYGRGMPAAGQGDHCLDEIFCHAFTSRPRCHYHVAYAACAAFPAIKNSKADHYAIALDNCGVRTLLDCALQLLRGQRIHRLRVKIEQLFLILRK